MDREKAAELVSGRIPIAAVVVDWESTGYNTASFDAWARSADFSGWEGDRPAAEEVGVMTALLSLKRKDSVLDLACGYGRHAEVLAREYGMKVVGMDMVPGLIKAAARRAAKEGLAIEYRVGRAAELDYGGAFDAVIVAFNSFSLFSPADVPGILAAIGRALKEGGRLFLDLDNRDYCLRSGPSSESWERWEHGWKLQETFFDQATSIETDRDIYVDERSGESEEFVIVKRLYSAPEIESVLSSAGFSVTSVTGDWDGSVVCESKPKIILAAAKTAD